MKNVNDKPGRSRDIAAPDGTSLVFVGAAILCLVGCTGAERGEDVGASSSALTADQCRFFAGGKEVRVCHRTESIKKPYVVLDVSVDGCIGHAAHVGDFVAEGDPTCRGQGCFPLGAPYDGTVPCCAGLAPQGGTCQDIDACVNNPCGPNQVCADLPPPAPDDASGRTCTCAPGFGDCNGSPSDGCEVDLGSSFANCGACGAYCVGDCVNGGCVPTCGNGQCNGGETCSNCARDCGTCPAPACAGTPGQWSGCRGSGCAVCAELLVGFPHYLDNHPACVGNPTCAGQFFTCNADCPAPTAADQ